MSVKKAPGLLLLEEVNRIEKTLEIAFLDKGRFVKLLNNVPIYVILNPGSGLLGAASYGLSE